MLIMLMKIDEEKILFEEISALGAINVENAFHNVLEGIYPIK